MKKEQPARDEVQGSGVRPDLVLKPFGISPGKYQRQAVPMGGALGQPVARFWPIWRIAPDQSLPRSSQSVVLDGVMGASSFPRAFDRRTGVEVEWSKRIYNDWRRQPFFFAVNEVAVMSEVRFLSGSQNDVFHWKIVFGTILFRKSSRNFRRTTPKPQIKIGGYRLNPLFFALPHHGGGARNITQLLAG